MILMGAYSEVKNSRLILLIILGKPADLFFCANTSLNSHQTEIMILDKILNTESATDYGPSCHSTPLDAFLYTWRLMLISLSMEYRYLFPVSRKTMSQPADLVKFPYFSTNTEFYLEAITYFQH
jgi:hypothetical protein